MSEVVVFCNFKGGVGKTTNSCMVAYELAKMGKKTLLVDLDPQGNATDIMINTYYRFKEGNDDEAKFELGYTLMDLIKMQNLSVGVHHILPNLDLLPSAIDLVKYNAFLILNYVDKPVEKAQHFDKLLEPLKANYDYIIIDVPPTVSETTDSVLYTSDYAVFVVETQSHSLQGSQRMLRYFAEAVEVLDTEIEILGVLPVIMKVKAPVDTAILQSMKEIFGEEEVMPQNVRYMERLKRYGLMGITDNKSDVHDKRVHSLYKEITLELLNRMHS